MVEKKYEKYIVSDLKLPEQVQAGLATYNQWATRILWLDEDVVPGAFQTNCSWYRKPSKEGAKAHKHDYDEVIAFIGGDPDNPNDLCGEVEFWIEDEKYILNKSTLIFAPKGIKHCPLQVLRADRPIFHFTVVMGGKYVQKPVDEQQKTPQQAGGEQTAGRKYEKYILTELKLPEDAQARLEEYSKRATRILWLEDEIIEGAFSIICSWYWKATEEEGTPSHQHEFDEVIGFIGSDPENPTDLGGEVEFWIEDEKYTLTKSCYIFCPAGVRHSPLRVARVDRPIFFLAISSTKKYVKDKIVRAGE